MRESVRKIFALVTLAVFVQFMCANTMFFHNHRLSTGDTIIHSHPYNHHAQHSHTSNTLTLIAHCNFLVSTVLMTSLTDSIDKPSDELVAVIVCPQVLDVCSGVVSFRLSRAPPVAA